MPRFTSVTQQQLAGPGIPQDLTANVTTARLPSCWRSVLARSSSPKCFAWNTSGTKFWLGDDAQTLTEFTVSEPWDLSSTVTAVFARISLGFPLQAIDLKPDLSRIYILDGGTLREFIVTPGTIQDSFTAGATVNLTTVLGGPPAEDLMTGLAWAPSGLHFTVSADLTDRLVEFSLSVAWDLTSTVSVSRTLSYTTDTSPLSFQWSSDGLSYWVLGGVNQRLYQYSTDTAHRLPATLTQTSQTAVLSALTLESSRSSRLGREDQRVYLLGGTSLRRITQLELGQQALISTVFKQDRALEDQQINTALAGTTGAASVAFRADGLRMYTLNSAANRIFQSTLTTAWDISTAVVDTNVALSAGPGQCRGLYLHPEGTSYFVVGTTEDRIYQYSMPTPWNIAGSTNLAFSGSFSTEDTEAHGVFFRADGLRAWVVGQSSDQVHEYTLGTAWDITGLSYSQSGTFTLFNPTDLAFDSTGRRLWILESGVIWQYRLTTPWDISTKQFETSLDLGSYDSLFTGMFVRADGRKIYTVTEWSRWYGVTLGAPTASMDLTASVSGGADEGDTITFSLDTQNISDGTEFRWSIDPDHLEDFVPSSGSVTVTADTATWQILAEPDFVIEGEETWSLSVTKPSGTPVAGTGDLALSDTFAANFVITSPAGSQGFEWSTSSSLEFEVSITSGSAPDGYTFYWTTDSPQLFTASSGTWTWNSGTGLGTFTVIPLAAQSGTFTVSIRRGSITGPILATSAAVTLRDYSIVSSAASVDEGSTVTFTINVIGSIPDGTVRYWSVTNSGDFDTSSGSVEINSQTAQFTVTATADGNTEGAETFTASVRSGSTVGPILATSSSITINDTSDGFVAAGQEVFATAGTFDWTAPAGVFSVSVVAIGGGAAGDRAETNRWGGGGGGLGWKNNISVVPEQTYTVVVGAAGSGDGGPPGGDSYFIDTSTVVGFGGLGRAGGGLGGSFVGDGGGAGGNGAQATGANNTGGGGGAGGYSGAGGNGGVSLNNGANGSGGGAGGGAGSTLSNGGGGGGGVGLLGEGSSGAGGINGFSTRAGGGGSGGSNGSGTYQGGGVAGVYGGGGGMGSNSGGLFGGQGQAGAVRIIWGTGRSFPSTNTANGTYSVATNVAVYDEGQTITATVTSSGVPPGTVVYWVVVPTTGDLSPNSGNLTINSDSTQFTLLCVNDGLTEDPEIFTIQIKTAQTGLLLASTTFTLLSTGGAGTGL